MGETWRWSRGPARCDRLCAEDALNANTHRNRSRAVALAATADATARVRFALKLAIAAALTILALVCTQQAFARSAPESFADLAALMEFHANNPDAPNKPVAVMMLGILNFVLDYDKARDIVRQVLAAVPSGSFLVLTHPTFDDALGGEAKGLGTVYSVPPARGLDPHRRLQHEARGPAGRAAAAELAGCLGCGEPGQAARADFLPL